MVVLKGEIRKFNKFSQLRMLLAKNLIDGANSMVEESFGRSRFGIVGGGQRGRAGKGREGQQRQRYEQHLQAQNTRRSNEILGMFEIQEDYAEIQRRHDS